MLQSSLVSENDKCMLQITKINCSRSVEADQIGAKQPDSTIDVKANPSRGYDCLWICHVKGGHISNGKAISRVHVWQCDRLLQGRTTLLLLSYTYDFY